MAALREPLHGLLVSDDEHRVLEWAAGLDVTTVAVLVALLHRARAASPAGTSSGTSGCGAAS